MFTQILEILRTWHVVIQLLFSMFIATLGTILMMSLIGAIGNFFNNSLPTIIRGYPPTQNENSEENKNEDEK
jgi:hypothetical protein